MAVKSAEKFGIIFTVVFAGSIYVIINVVSLSFSNDAKILLAAGCIAIISISGALSYRKKPPRSSSVISSNKYILLFISGIFLGVIIMWGIEITHGNDYQNTDVLSFLFRILLAFGAYSGMYYFIAMAMVVSITRIPLIKRNLSGSSPWIPIVEGTTLGFGVMAFLQLFWYGIPKL